MTAKMVSTDDDEEQGVSAFHSDPHRSVASHFRVDNVHTIPTSTQVSVNKISTNVAMTVHHGKMSESQRQWDAIVQVIRLAVCRDVKSSRYVAVNPHNGFHFLSH
jgi:DNA gyrase inhibitor GyrI